MPGIPGIVKDGIFFSLVEANEDTKKLTARYGHLPITFWYLDILSANASIPVGI